MHKGAILAIGCVALASCKGATSPWDATDNPYEYAVESTYAELGVPPHVKNDQAIGPARYDFAAAPAPLRATERTVAAAVESGAVRCAPKEIARAQVLLDVASRETDVERAKSLAASARTAANEAAARSPKDQCTPRIIDGDRDGDGVKDSLDTCPDVPGKKDHGGCPVDDADRDSDGIADKMDKCPDAPEDKDGFQDDDGCPDPDNDQDGIADINDKCPNTAGPKPDGCPASVQAAVATTATTPAVTGPSLVAASPQPAAYAFIIGIDRYRDVPAATGARADAESFARVARQTLGLREDHVRVAIEDRATRSDVLGGLKWLKDNVTAGGRVYFFFSGHGAPAPDQSTYLLPYDGNAKDIAGSAVSVSDVMKALGETQAKEVLAVVDACFSGAGGRSVLPPGARPLMRVKDPAPAAQMALLTASQGDEISGPAPGEAVGVFTKFVIQGLGTGQADTNGDGQVSLQELSDWVGPRVARDAKKDNRDQHPKLVLGKGVATAANFIVEYGLPTK